MRPSVACAKRADGGAAWLDRRRAGCFWVVAACLAALPVAPAAAAPAAGSAPAASSVRAVPAASAAPAAPASTGLGAATAIDPTASVDPVPAEPGARLRELDPEALDAAAVRDVLSHVPAPRILLFQGSVPLVTMAPVAEFLIAMGYPAAQLADPRTGGYSRSSFADASRLAGEVAWHYERDGMRPLLIGHSQGGMIAIRILHELAGGFRDELPVWDPVSDAPLPRTTIVDPLTGAERPVVGLSVSYASALATGMLPRLMLGQWDMIRRLHDIPDSVDEFVGFVLPFDPIAGTLGGGAPYAASGRAQVRNVTLPASYRHIGLPDIAHLAADPVTREWIERYTPTASLPPPDAEADTTNLLHAAILWHDVKKHWCIESQRLRAARVRLAGGT